jgi:uncharacterized protein
MTIPAPLAMPGRPQSAGRTSRSAYEALAVMAISLIPGLIWPQIKGPLQFLPVIYLLVERPLRHRTWREIGLDPWGFGLGLRLTWPLVLLVAVGTQVLTALLARAFWPELFAHILERLPLVSPLTNPVGVFVAIGLTLLLGTLLEELIYRGLFQERLSWLIGAVPAVVVVALIFGLMHIVPGNPAIVAVDVLGVMVDGVIYGAIFARGRNLYVSWLAHFAADVVGLGLLLLLR